MKVNLKKTYRDLEMSVLESLRDSINNSNIFSKHREGKCIAVNLFGYTEMVISNDRLEFLDNDGFGYSLFSDAALEDLIDILEKKQ